MAAPIPIPLPKRKRRRNSGVMYPIQPYFYVSVIGIPPPIINVNGYYYDNPVPIGASNLNLSKAGINRPMIPHPPVFPVINTSTSALEAVEFRGMHPKEEDDKGTQRHSSIFIYTLR